MFTPPQTFVYTPQFQIRSNTFLIIKKFLVKLFSSPPSPYMQGKYLFPLAMSAETATIYLTLLVTLNRYIAVCMPYDVADLCSIRHARRHVIGVVVFSVLFNIPRFFEYDVILEQYWCMSRQVPDYEWIDSRARNMNGESGNGNTFFD